MPIPKLLDDQFKAIPQKNSELTFKLALFGAIEKTQTVGVGIPPSQKIIWDSRSYFRDLKDLYDKYEKSQHEDKNNRELTSAARAENEKQREATFITAIKKWEEFEATAKARLAIVQAVEPIPALPANPSPEELKAKQDVELKTIKQKIVTQLSSSVNVQTKGSVTELMLNIIYYDNLQRIQDLRKEISTLQKQIPIPTQIIDAKKDIVIKAQAVIKEINETIPKLHNKVIKDADIMTASTYVMENFPDIKNPFVQQQLAHIMAIQKLGDERIAQLQIGANIERAMKGSSGPRESAVNPRGLDEKSPYLSARPSVMQSAMPRASTVSQTPRVSASQPEKLKTEYLDMMKGFESYVKAVKSKKAGSSPVTSFKALEALMTGNALPDYVDAKALRVLLKAANADSPLAMGLNKLLSNEKNRKLFFDRLFASKEDKAKKAIDIIFRTSQLNSLHQLIYPYLSQFADKKNIADYSLSKIKDNYHFLVAIAAIKVEESKPNKPPLSIISLKQKALDWKKEQIENANPKLSKAEIEKVAKLTVEETVFLETFSIGLSQQTMLGNFMKADKLPDFVTQETLINFSLASPAIIASLSLQKTTLVDRILYGDPSESIHSRLDSYRKGLEFANMIMVKANNSIEAELKVGGAQPLSVQNPVAAPAAKNTEDLKFKDALILGGSFAIKTDNKDFLIRNFGALANVTGGSLQILAEKWFAAISKPLPPAISPAVLNAYYKNYKTTPDFLTRPDVIKTMIQSNEQLQILLKKAIQDDPLQAAAMLKTLQTEMQKFKDAPDSSLFKGMDRDAVLTINQTLLTTFKALSITLQTEMQKFQNTPDSSLFKGMDRNAVLTLNQTLTTNNGVLTTLPPPLPILSEESFQTLITNNVGITTPPPPLPILSAEALNALHAAIQMGPGRVPAANPPPLQSIQSDPPPPPQIPAAENTSAAAPPPLTTAESIPPPPPATEVFILQSEEEMSDAIHINPVPVTLAPNVVDKGLENDNIRVQSSIPVAGRSS